MPRQACNPTPSQLGVPWSNSKDAAHGVMRVSTPSPWCWLNREVGMTEQVDCAQEYMSRSPVITVKRL
jgi:hypothetical protein